VAADKLFQVQRDGKTLKPFVEPIESPPASPLRWIVGATAIVIVVLLIYRKSRRCPSGSEAHSVSGTRWLRFSLRTLLLLITAMCVWLGMNVPAARRQKEAVPVLLKAGAALGYDYEFVPMAPPPHRRWDPEQSPPGPTWLRERIGEDYFQTVVAVFFNRPNLGIKKADLDQLAKLPHVTDFVFDGRGTSVHDQDFTALADLHELEMLQFMRARIDGSILKWLPNPGRLKSLCLGMTDIDDAALVALDKMTALEVLLLYGTHVTDAGLEHLRNLTNLEELWLNQTQVTDAGLQHLAGLKKLTLLSLQGTKVSKAGVSALRTELPKANIIWP
jgi:hypothetical protein